MRISPSCGYGRLFLEQPGENIFTFSFYLDDPDWKQANAQQLASHQLKPPVYRLLETGGKGNLPPARSFLAIEGDQFALSSLYPGSSVDMTVARTWETIGRPGKAHFSGPLSEGQVLAVDFLGEGGKPLDGKPGSWVLDIPAWGIRTVLFKQGKDLISL